MKRNRRPSFLPAMILVLAAFLALICAVRPQQALGSDGKSHIKPYALIFGTVWDPQGMPAYGVKVKIRRADAKKAKWELYSDHRGEFAQRVPAGASDYVVAAEIKPQKGQPELEVREVKVHIENDERQDIALHLKKADTH